MKKIILAFIFCGLLFSCSSKKEILYFQDIENNDTKDFLNLPRYLPRLSPTAVALPFYLNIKIAVLNNIENTERRVPKLPIIPADFTLALLGWTYTTSFCFKK